MLEHQSNSFTPLFYFLKTIFWVLNYHFVLFFFVLIVHNYPCVNHLFNNTLLLQNKVSPRRKLYQFKQLQNNFLCCISKVVVFCGLDHKKKSLRTKGFGLCAVGNPSRIIAYLSVRLECIFKKILV